MLPNARDSADDDAIVAYAASLSRYARRALAAEPGMLPAAAIRVPLNAFDALRGQAMADEAQLSRELRRLRKRVMLRLIARDLAGLATLEEVVGSVTELADATIACALDHWHGWLVAQHGEPIGAESGAPQRLHVVGMGKLGGRELNVSSDIDLVFAYPEDGDTDGARALSNQEFFIRLARKLIGALNEMTADGFVFRVDMRLRPLGADGPLACPFGMLENYFVTQGREWERYAWIKARVVCGDRAAELLDLVRPFVFRRHLDYSAFESMRDLHGQVRREVERRDILGNIKLGPGGIREVEFIVQLFQLVRGGRDAELRAPPTLQVLPLLTARNLLPADAVRELEAAYRFLRKLEHRLQYLDDKQTQTLPHDADDQQLIATAMGFPGYAALEAGLETHRNRVTRHFEDIFAPSSEEAHPLAALWDAAPDEARGDAGPDEARGALTLETLGYKNPLRALAQLAELRASSRVQQMPEAGLARMKQLVPLVVDAAAKLPDPDLTLERMVRLLESICRREAYLALLLQYPQALQRAARLAHASPWAAGYLTQHPILLDELLDTTHLNAAPDWTQLRASLDAQLDEAGADIERQMDMLRHFKHSHTMRLIAQDLGGELPLERLSDCLSELADLILSAVLRITWRALRTRHREDPLFAVIAYGKLGGKELGYASDLDLIFLHEDPRADAAENYARLAQRLNNWLTSLTSAGVLYETDLRLRPDGVSGLLVSSLEGFADYQRKQAWVWEHQALTRARFVAGDHAIGERFEAIRTDVLRAPRDLDLLRTEVVAMRQKMLAAHPNTSGRFDLKHDRGGLIDVEFIVQYLVLGHAAQHAVLTRNAGNLALLKCAAGLALIPAPMAAAAHDAYRRFRELQHGLRLQGDKYARIERSKVAAEIAAVEALSDLVLGGI